MDTEKIEVETTVKQNGNLKAKIQWDWGGLFFGWAWGCFNLRSAWQYVSIGLGLISISLYLNKVVPFV